MLKFRERTTAWPGFVDLFSNLVIILIFLLIVFVFLWTTTGVFSTASSAKKMAQLAQANAEKEQTINQMLAEDEEARQLLVLARGELEDLEAKKVALESELSAMDKMLLDREALLDQYESDIIQLETASNNVQEKVKILTQQLSVAEKDSAEAADLRRQKESLTAELARMNAALSAAEEKSRAGEVEYAALSERLNKALADKVAELSKMAAKQSQMEQYQSAFYTAIKTALAGFAGIQMSGDRFVVPSDILFSSGSYTLSPEGKKQLRIIANVIMELENKIPTDINWIIRVDGHTDKKPVIAGTPGYRNNTELSLLRARAVSRELIRDGVSRRRLIPSGFGELYPAELGTDKASLQKNRRIELRLTNP
jgi:chemotaxis protein MotB